MENQQHRCDHCGRTPQARPLSTGNARAPGRTLTSSGRAGEREGDHNRWTGVCWTAGGNCLLCRGFDRELTVSIPKRERAWLLPLPICCLWFIVISFSSIVIV